MPWRRARGAKSQALMCTGPRKPKFLLNAEANYICYLWHGMMAESQLGAFRSSHSCFAGLFAKIKGVCHGNEIQSAQANDRRYCQVAH